MSKLLLLSLAIAISNFSKTVEARHQGICFSKGTKNTVNNHYNNNHFHDAQPPQPAAPVPVAAAAEPVPSRDLQAALTAGAGSSAAGAGCDSEYGVQTEVDLLQFKEDFRKKIGSKLEMRRRRGQVSDDPGADGGEYLESEMIEEGLLIEPLRKVRYMNGKFRWAPKYGNKVAYAAADGGFQLKYEPPGVRAEATTGKVRNWGANAPSFVYGASGGQSVKCEYWELFSDAIGTLFWKKQEGTRNPTACNTFTDIIVFTDPSSFTFKRMKHEDNSGKHDSDKCLRDSMVLHVGKGSEWHLGSLSNCHGLSMNFTKQLSRLDEPGLEDLDFFQHTGKVTSREIHDLLEEKKSELSRIRDRFGDLLDKDYAGKFLVNEGGIKLIKNFRQVQGNDSHFTTYFDSVDWKVDIAPKVF